MRLVLKSGEGRAQRPVQRGGRSRNIPKFNVPVSKVMENRISIKAVWLNWAFNQINPVFTSSGSAEMLKEFSVFVTIPSQLDLAAGRLFMVKLPVEGNEFISKDLRTG